MHCETCSPINAMNRAVFIQSYTIFKHIYLSSVFSVFLKGAVLCDLTDPSLHYNPRRKSIYTVCSFQIRLRIQLLGSHYHGSQQYFSSIMGLVVCH